MNKCSWFDSAAHIQNFVPFPETFTDLFGPNKYVGVVSELKKSSLLNRLNFTNLDAHNLTNNDISDLLYAHKYHIKFSDEQHEVLVKYFKECKRVYNLCVDIWIDYKDVTHDWKVLKTSIFKELYKNPNNVNKSLVEIKNLIINDLKIIKDIFITEQLKYKEEYTKLKDQVKAKYAKEMKIYKEKLLKNKKSTVKEVLIKPVLEKVKLDKPKKEPKQRDKSIKKPAPDDTLKAVIRDFCTALSNARNKAFEDGKFDKNTKKFHDNAYEMKHKHAFAKQTISISDRAISSKGIFSQSLGKLKCNNFKKLAKKYNFDKECKLQYDKLSNMYYLFVVVKKPIKVIPNRNKIVALDCGEKIFQYFYSNEMIGKLGDNMRVKILKIQRKIKKYQRALSTSKNKTNTRLRNRKRIKRRINNLYKKIKGFVNEVHKKSAKFLCENYENIMIPEFKVKPMISKGKIKSEIERIKNIQDAIQKRIEFRKLKRISQLSGEVKFVLSMQSHNKFKEYLKAVAKRYRTNIHIVDESYTSQSCTRCGILSKKYDKNRLKTCPNCQLKIDRDVNGSRNIYIKCISSQVWCKPDVDGLPVA